MLLSRKERNDLWFLQDGDGLNRPPLAAPGLEQYLRAVRSFLGVKTFPHTKLHASVRDDFIISPLIATGNPDTGTIQIIDGFRRLYLGVFYDKDVTVRLYDNTDLNDPADILRIRLSMNTESSSSNTLSEALAIHSVWTSTALKNQSLTRSEERRVLEAVVRKDATMAEAVLATRRLFGRADINSHRFTHTLHPLVHYPHELQCDMFINWLRAYSAVSGRLFRLMPAAVSG